MVRGANDGLVSNLALVLGVSATGVATHTVLATGIAGLLAGALQGHAMNDVMRRLVGQIGGSVTAMDCIVVGHREDGDAGGLSDRGLVA